MAEEKIGLVLPYEDVRVLAEALAFLAARPLEREEMDRKARELYERRNSFTEQCRRLQETYSNIGAEVH
ncbi:MAG: hypothetical protein AB1556_15270 [Bacillota bacterium]